MKKEVRWLPCRGAMAMTVALLLLTQARAQQVLTIAAYPAVDKIATSAIAQWRKTHPNVDVKVVSRPYTQHHAAMTTALASAKELPDVMVVEFGFVGRFAEGGGLEDLGAEPFSVKSRQLRFVPFAFRQAISSAGSVVAVPSDIGPGTLLYRADILKKAGVTESELTQSWDSYIAAGIKIKAKTGAYLMANARDIKDIAIRTDARARDGQLAYWRPGEGLYISKRGKVLVESARFVRAFELAKKVRDLKLDGNIGTWSKEWTEGFKSGTVATQMSGAWLAGHMSNWMAPDTRGLWRAAQLPERAWGSWGGSFYAIPKAGRNKALAWEFIQMMTLDPDVQLSAFKQQDAFPALVAVHDDAFFEQPIDFLGGQKARLLWREASSKISAVDVNRLDPVAEEIVNAQMDLVLDHGKGIASALADARAQLEQRMRP